MENKQHILSRFLKIDDEKVFKTFLQNLFVGFFKQKAILDSRRNALVDKLQKSFPQYNDCTIKIAERLDVLSKDDPKIIYEIILEYFQDKALITKIIDVARKAHKADCNDLVYQMEFIADFYEIIEIFKLTATLFSYSASYPKITREKGAILKQLKNFELTNNNIETIRLVRNSSKHKFLIQGGYLITEKKDKIPISDINSLFISIDTLTSWLFTFTLRASSHIPRFSFIVIMTFYSDADKNDKIWEEHVNGLKILYKGLTNKIKASNEKKSKNKNSIKKRYRRIKRKIKYFIKYKLFPKRQKIPDNFPDFLNLIINNSEFQIKRLQDDIKELKGKINDKNIESKIEKFSDWIAKKSIIFMDFKEYYENNSDEVLNEFYKKTATNTQYSKWRRRQ